MFLSNLDLFVRLMVKDECNASFPTLFESHINHTFLACAMMPATKNRQVYTDPIRNLEKKDFDPVALPVGQIRVAVRVGRRSTDLYPIDTTTAFEPASKTLPHSFSKWNLMSQDFIRSRNLQNAFTNMIPCTQVFSVMGFYVASSLKYHYSAFIILSFKFNIVVLAASKQQAYVM